MKKYFLKIIYSILNLFLISNIAYASNTIPNNFLGKWDKSTECRSPALIMRKSLTADTDYGEVKIKQLISSSPTQITVHGNEIYGDADEIDESPASLTLTLLNKGTKLRIQGQQHMNNYNEIYVRCK